MPQRNRFTQVLTVFSIGLIFQSFSTSVQADSELEIDVIKNVVYSQPTEKVKLKADVYQPKINKVRPGILMIHGGAWAAGSKTDMRQHARKIATRGYVVVSINYRLAPKHKFPAQIDDCKAAVRWIKQNAQKYKIDPSKIAAYGYSAGAHLACMLATTDEDDGFDGHHVKEDELVSTRINAFVAGGAPVDFQVIPKQSKALAYWLGGTRKEKPEVYKNASPTTFVTADDPPGLFFHGSKDTLVPLASPKRMSELMAQVDVKTDLMVVEAGHMGAFFNTSAIEKAGKFLDSQFGKHSD